MFGGGLMLWTGLLMMLVVFGLPVLLLAVLAGGLVMWFQRQNQPRPQSPATPPAQPTVQPFAQPAPQPERACAHCGAGLRAGWTHCPHCGAPAQ